MASGEIEVRCEVHVDPAEVPPNAVFVLECPQVLSTRQRLEVQEMWKHGPLGAFQVMILNGGIKMKAYVPVEDV